MSIVAHIMGVFYMVWYPMLAWDLLRLARGRSTDKTEGDIARVLQSTTFSGDR